MQMITVLHKNIKEKKVRKHSLVVVSGRPVRTLNYSGTENCMFYGFMIL